MRRIRKVHFALMALVLLCVLAFSPADRYFEIAKNIDIFASLFKEVNKLYVDDISPTKIAHTGIDQMLNSLDPYTNYISEDQVEDYRTQNTGQYGGIGALTRVFNKKTMVTMVYADYPAYKNGLRIGDEVIKMDDIELSKLSLEEANHLMRGQVGTPVKLSIKRYGQDQPFDLEFKREKIKINNVPYSGMLADDVGYIQLTEFTPDAGKEVKTALVSLKEKGAKNIILDLRGNPGGLLFEAVNICNLFVPKGKKIVDTKGKLAEHNVTYETLNNPVDTEIPVVVLINRGSASASEIVAGTLQDYDRAVIVGERSFGKGLVQLSRPLPYHAQVKITTAKYYTPTGRCIQVLDYTHRREDGSAGSVPDSLKKEFKTSKGRKVYDGGGIDPDVKLPAQEASSITQALHVSGFIFDYATQYAFSHSTIQDPKTFALTDKEYDNFVQWMKDKNYTYHTALQSELTALEEEAKREKYFDQLKPSIETLQAKLKESRKNDLMNFKDQIKTLLEEEIAARYYLEKGAVEARFKYDLEIKKAVDIFHDQSFYKKILGSN
ncbi:MAG: S41 family peptidase [Cytophagales bacterium]|nr:S41 family peptidase [Cytophagales bacterium]MCA6367736.1 S41 family peptidase [Cytophagales bacterium]MCA6369980.1 S41 family peptidase [Cytophagales bacterium]MCA6375139.1 S41 family peptidase [Cytophagales bacterium]MCA6382551.1 S41 family peptidase [Cytophagales bacterium]